MLKKIERSVRARRAAILHYASAAAMRIVADRFVETDRGRVVDLATGEIVFLMIASAGGPSDQLRWAARCDLLHRLHHPSLARLVDYGRRRVAAVRGVGWLSGSALGFVERR